MLVELEELAATVEVTVVVVAEVASVATPEDRVVSEAYGRTP